jgi:hypothetical protein
MPRMRKSHPPCLKAKVAIEAIKAHKTTAQIAQMFGVRPTQVGGKRGTGRLAGRFQQRPRAGAATGRRGKGRTLQADRPTQSGVGLSQKTSWPHQLRNAANGSTPGIRT